jgi:hypothetical protein
MSVHIQDSPLKAYCEAWLAEDVDAIVATLTPDVSFHSPITGSAAFEGRKELHELFTVVTDVLSDLRHHTDIGDDRTRMLAATARLGRQEIEEAALLRLDEHGLIEDITLWIRPLPALTAMMAALGSGLAWSTGRRGLPLLVGAATRPLAALTRLGDRTLVPLLTPRRD